MNDDQKKRLAEIDERISKSVVVQERIEKAVEAHFDLLSQSNDVLSVDQAKSLLILNEAAAITDERIENLRVFRERTRINFDAYNARKARREENDKEN